MRDEGFILLWRKAFSHELWREKRAFSRWEAWEDLWAGQAAFADHKRIVGGEAILVARGQLIASQRFLANRWRWSVGKVRRFLAYLKAQDMMLDESRLNAGRIKTDTGIGTLYTIVNYPLMQDLRTAIVSATDQQRTGNEPKIKKGKKGIEESSPSGEPKKTAFVPTEQHRLLAVSLRVNVDRELEKFHDHILVKAPKWKDLNAAFRNWLRRAAEYNGAKVQQPDDDDAFLAKLRKELI